MSAAEQDDADLAASLMEEAGGDEAVSAVVAPAAEDGDARGVGVLAEAEGGDGGSGAFHEVREWGARLDGASVGRGHLGRAEDLHGWGVS